MVANAGFSGGFGDDPSWRIHSIVQIGIVDGALEARRSAPAQVIRLLFTYLSR